MSVEYHRDFPVEGHMYSDETIVERGEKFVPTISTGKIAMSAATPGARGPGYAFEG